MWRKHVRVPPAHSDLPQAETFPIRTNQGSRMNGQASLVNTIELVEAISFKDLQKTPTNIPQLSWSPALQREAHPAQGWGGQVHEDSTPYCAGQDLLPGHGHTTLSFDSRMPPQSPLQSSTDLVGQQLLKVLWTPFSNPVAPSGPPLSTSPSSGPQSGPKSWPGI